MQFLNYNGSCEKITPDYYKFDFKNGFESECKPVFIVPPIYDVSFKKVFYNKVNGLKILKDFLNSLIFPETQAIVELKFIHKEILSNSHLKKNKGTRIVKEGIKEGRIEGNLELLDNFIKRFKDKEVLQNIFLLEKVSSSLLIERYGNTQIVKKFIKKLFEQKWLIDSQINY